MGASEWIALVALLMTMLSVVTGLAWFAGWELAGIKARLSAIERRLPEGPRATIPLPEERAS